MANVVVSEATHHKLKVFCVENDLKMQDAADFFIRWGVNFHLDDTIVDVIKKYADKESMSLHSMLNAMVGYYANRDIK